MHSLGLWEYHTTSTKIIKEGIRCRYRPQADSTALVIKEGLIGCVQCDRRNEGAVLVDLHSAIFQSTRAQLVSIREGY